MTTRTRAALASLSFAAIILGGFAGLDCCTNSAALATGCVLFGGAVALATQGLVGAWEEARKSLTERKARCTKTRYVI